jgi:enoyl-CoA hydratase
VEAGTRAGLDLRSAVSPQGLRETKPLLTAAVLDGFDTKAAALAELSARLFGSAEAAEGMAAFLEKRRPSFAAE